MPEEVTQEFLMPDGRVLRGLLRGSDTDDLVLFCHGTPFPSVPYDLFFNESEARGLGFLTWARPGYGESTPQPGRSVRSFADDAHVILDAVGAKRVIAMGWSGGGPHALSLGAKASEFCRVVVTIGSVAPYGEGELDWVEGMGPENIREFSLAQEGGPTFEAFLQEEAAGMHDLTPTSLHESIAGLLSHVDVDALSEEGMAEMLAMSARAGVQTGIDGWLEDDEAFFKRWGFSVASIDVPVSLWHGTDDVMVPLSHAVWLEQHLNKVIAHLLPEEGHLSLVTRYFGAMLDEALEMGGIE